MIEAIPFLLQGLGTTVIITFGSFLIGAACAVPVALARLFGDRTASLGGYGVH